MADALDHLATHRRCVERIQANWSAFLEQRAERLRQQERYGSAAEKVAENILEDRNCSGITKLGRVLHCNAHKLQAYWGQ
jgi:hypothetical protein